MPRSQTTDSRLAKLLEHAPDPVYVLDDRRTIVFCNRALSVWTGVDRAALVGRRVDYHSHAGTADGADVAKTAERAGVAVGLCPPPVALAGEEATGHVSCMSPDGHLLHRRARFVPLGVHRGRASGDVDCHGVVVFVEPADRDAGDLASAAAEPTADQLHLAIRRFRRSQANRYELDSLVGESPAIRKVRAQVVLAAESSASVLIVGPTGTGRSHVARAIHYGTRREEPGKLVPISCGRLGEDLLGRTIDSVVAEQRGGARVTLLLEDVDELSGEGQTRLATLRRDAMHVRLIATSGAPLERLAKDGRFRHDLACALGTIVIEMPPLAQRLEDLPILAQMFLEEENRAGGTQLGGIAPEALDLLASYPWSDELDELAGAVAAAHEKADGPEITVADLPAKFHHAVSAATRPRRQDEPVNLEELLADVETQLIRQALARAGGNKTKAAQLLGMTRPRLYRRLVQLGLGEENVATPRDTP